MDVDKAPAEYNAGVDWLHTFSYRGSRTSATSEHIDAINRYNTNIIYNAIYYDYIAGHIKLLLYVNLMSAYYI